MQNSYSTAKVAYFVPEEGSGSTVKEMYCRIKVLLEEVTRKNVQSQKVVIYKVPLLYWRYTGKVMNWKILL